MNRKNVSASIIAITFILMLFLALPILIIPHTGFIRACNTTINAYTNFKSESPVFGERGFIGYYIPTGNYSPGDSLFIALYVSNIDKYDPSVSYKVELYRIFDQCLVLDLSKDINLNYSSSGVRYGFSLIQLPKVLGSQYLIVVKALKSGKVIDLIYSKIRVPLTTLGAEISLNKNSFHVGETLVYNIENIGYEPIVTGLCYRLYRWNTSEWVNVNLTAPCLLVAFTLDRGDSISIKVDLNGFKPGIYELVVDVSGEYSNTMRELHVYFVIVE